MQYKTMANPILFRPAALALLALLLVRPVFGGAYDDLVNAAGGNVPNVPSASGPVREDGEDAQARNEAEQERRQARAEAREAAREERARVREERAKARAIQKAKDDAEKQAKLEEAEERKRLQAEQEQKTRDEAAERDRQAVLKSQRAVAASKARATWDARDGDAYAGVFRDALNSAPRESREQTLARIAKLRSQIEATQNQFRQLNRDIQSDAIQFEVWEKASDEGIDNIWGIAGDMTAIGVDHLGDHYRALKKIGKENGQSTADLRYKLRRVRLLLHAKNLEEAYSAAAAEHTTPLEILESFGGAFGATLAELGMHPVDQLIGDRLAKAARLAGPVWTYSKLAVDVSYTVLLYQKDKQAVAQLRENNAGFKLAVGKLSDRMEKLVKELQDNEAKLRAAGNADPREKNP